MHAEDSVIAERPDRVVATFSLSDKATVHQEDLFELSSQEPDTLRNAVDNFTDVSIGTQLIRHANSLLAGFRPGIQGCSYYHLFAIPPQLGLAKAFNTGQVNDVGRIVIADLGPNSPPAPQGCGCQSARRLTLE